jgi:cation:H+ antiporter
MTIQIALFAFLICGSIIFIAGKKLSYYGDLLAEKTGMGKAWLGLILMSAVTSLPELMVGISSAAIVKSADLAVGDILGSCAFNLGILSLMDAIGGKKNPILSQVSQNHVLAASLGIILIAMTGMGMYIDKDIILTPSLGITSLSFAVIYLISLRIIYGFNKKNQTVENIHNTNELPSLKKIIQNYALYASIIIVSALALPQFAEVIAHETGLGKSFVGTLFLAISTSLPEIAVSIAAVRLGAADIAVGNLLGSNIFNIFILFLDDLFYTNGHILKDAHPSNLISVISVIMMSAVAVIGLTYKLGVKRFILAWDTFAIFILWVFNMTLLYLYS